MAGLGGKTVVVTRAPDSSAELADRLRARGAAVVLFPTIQIAPPKDAGPLASALADLEGYDWLLFTSPRAVVAVRRLAAAAGIFLDPLAGLRVCAVGPTTARAVEDELGRGVDLLPERYVAEGVLEAVDRWGSIAGERILFPAAVVVRDTLPNGLRERGAHIDVVEAYRTIPAGVDAGPLIGILREGAIDVVTFTASSTVERFHDAVGSSLGGARVAVIGPVTAETARRLGYEVPIVAAEYTLGGLVTACERYFDEER